MKTIKLLFLSLFIFLGQILLSQGAYKIKSSGYPDSLITDSIKGIVISYLNGKGEDTINYVGDWNWDVYYENNTDTLIVLQLNRNEPIIRDTNILVTNIINNMRYSKMDYLRDEFNTSSKEYISMVKEENAYKLIGLMASLVYGLISIIPFFIKYSTMDYRSVLLELMIIASICLALYFALPKVLSLIFNSQYNIIKALL